MHESIARHLPELRALCPRFGVARLEVFGSGARGADFDAGHSDADFVVEFDPAASLPALDQFFGLADALERVFGRPVDLVERGAVRNPYVLARIERERETVYAA